jgi:hypothetical protein
MGVVERIVELSAHPQAVQEHREFSCYGYHRSFLGVLASAGGYLLLSVAPEVRVRAKRTQDVVSAAYQELTLSISSPSLEMRL